mmetsp:Transcript_166677/g.319974  ORF Transcript_166677/g.319974 Transcript_166677/m.319974 type:complete len:709 (+) Transcript_166677:127-2253(+)
MQTRPQADLRRVYTWAAPLLRFLLICSLVNIEADAVQARSRSRINPIGKVIKLLMQMQQRVDRQGRKAKELFDEYKCYCKTMSESLEKSIADAKERAPQLESTVKEANAAKQQLTEDLKQLKSDREKAEAAVQEAKSLRESEAASFEKESSELKANINAIEKAVKALETGSGGFLQSRAASAIQKVSISMDMSNADRDLLSRFLSGAQVSEYAPHGEILGILKQMHVEMAGDLKQMQADEDTSVANSLAMLSAKGAEIAAAVKGIEAKTARRGDAGVKVVSLKNDLEDTQQGLEEDSKFFAELTKSCQTKSAEWEAYKKSQADEMVALAETVKILNEEVANKAFLQTSWNPSVLSFMQIRRKSRGVKRHALSILRSSKRHDPQLDFIELALRGRKIGFDQVIASMDKMVTQLHKEQKDEDEKKAYCESELAKTEEELKLATQNKEDMEKVIAEGADELKAIAADMQKLALGIKELDGEVAKATLQRKEEHSASVNALAENNGAKNLIEMAIKRLKKFYEPPAEAFIEKEEDESTIAADSNDGEAADGDSSNNIPAFVQVRQFGLDEDSEQSRQQPPDLSYEKNQGSGGVIGMLEMLKADIEKTIQELRHDEKQSQEDYEAFMKDSTEKRALDSKALADKEGAKANKEEEVQVSKTKHKGLLKEEQQTEKSLFELHADCDFLLKTYEVEKKARADEVDALEKAKSVLSG